MLLVCIKTMIKLVGQRIFYAKTGVGGTTGSAGSVWNKRGGTAMKKILFTGIGKAELTETEAPAIQPGHVLVETEYSAISAGTERANLIRMPNTDAYGVPEGSPVWGGGYSTVGIVRQIGEGVTSVAAGDRVVVCGAATSSSTRCRKSR